MLKRIGAEKSFAQAAPPTSPASPTSQPAPGPAPQTFDKLSTTSRQTKTAVVHPFDPVFGFRDLVDVWYAMNPDVHLYKWQYEELMRLSGYRTGSSKSVRDDWTIDDPYQSALVCANGSGKDMTVIATAAIGLPLLYRDVFVVITSSSFDQLKHQTQNHISRGIEKLNSKFGKVYDSVEFYHNCKATRGGEIKLFATDEAGRAEGWHPMEVGGRLVLIVNEAKSIPPPIFDAMDRCWGWSHWLEISSPGPRRGLFYDNFRRSIKYQPGVAPEKHKYFGRRVDSSQCDHITPEHERKLVEKHGENSYIVQTSLRANFHEQSSETIISINDVEACENVQPNEQGDYGIGLDASGGGDETSLYVRKGNRKIGELHFDREKDTIKAVNRVHRYLLDLGLSPFMTEPYVFNLDDGGMSRTFSDQLTILGWRTYKRLNQSAAFNKTKYLNLGAQIWAHTGLLFQRRQIPCPPDSKTIEQLTTRPYDESGHQGKIALMSKDKMKEDFGLDSPDRADAFCLCYFSYASTEPSPNDPPKPQGYTMEELAVLAERDPNFLENLFKQNTQPSSVGTYTLLK